MDQQRIEHAISAANLIFWLKVAEHFPEATGNELPPEVSHALVACHRKAITVWVGLNIPAAKRMAEPQDEPLEPGMHMLYRAYEDRDTWVVHAEGANGEVYSARFSGPEAEARALEYASFKNSRLR